VQELDFVLANVIMALVADFMLVWLPAPTLSFKCAPSHPHLIPEYSMPLADRLAGAICASAFWLP